MSLFLLSLCKKEIQINSLKSKTLTTKIENLLCVCILHLFFSCNDNQKTMENSNINIIPKPTNVETSGRSFDLHSINGVFVENNSKSEKHIAELFQNYLKPLKKLEIVNSIQSTENKIIISLDPKHKLDDEAYRLNIGDEGSIRLEASSTSGLFYGFQSFRQLCDPRLEVKSEPESTLIPSCTIIDNPSFSYRGMHLDVSRHFFDVDFVKTYIDMIALHKMNVFHWHLTDDNGWRIEIKKYPLLTEKSAWRVDRRHEPWKEQSPVKPEEEATYGGFYTQEQIKDVVAYAKKRNIMVIPEIEMPGHTSEVFAAYPELSCNNKYIPVNPGSYWPNVDIFCAGNDDVFSFLRDVLEEVSLLFPGPYIHIGGDEAEKENWKKCAKCQKRIKEKNLKNEHELQSWFIKEIEKFVISKKKKLIGWDEILEGGLAKSATVMSWRGFQGGIQSARSGHDVIMCPVSHCYFDYYQSNPEEAPAAAFGGMTTLKTVYSFNPIPKELDSTDSKYVLGGQGNLWTEYVQTPKIAQYRVLPRMSALSEVLWSGPGKNTYEDFYFRLRELKKRFEKLGWDYSDGSFEVGIKRAGRNNTSSFLVSLTSEHPGKPIYYTTSKEKPGKHSNVFEKAFPINKTTTIKAGILKPDGRLGPISEKTFYFHKAIGKKIVYRSNYIEKYSGSGERNLVDGLVGSGNHNDGYWQGWERDNMEVVVDLEKTEKINTVICGFLESHRSWIFLPKGVKISFSTDGETFINAREILLSDGENYGASNRKEVFFRDLNQSARYVLIKAINREVCPNWHAGSGGKAWVFSDEIVIE